jgi:hypothetical protein
MNIKYVSLFSLLFVTGANAILPDEIIDVAYSRYARAHQELSKCQETKDFFGRPYACTNEKNTLAAKSDEYAKVMSKMNNFLYTTVKQGNEASLFERSKKQKAQMAQKTINTINTFEQQTDNYRKLSREILWQSSDNFINLPGDKEAIKQFNNDLFKTIPEYYDYGFIRTY